jgi:hypothetical protein
MMKIIISRTFSCIGKFENISLSIHHFLYHMR